MAPQPKKRHAKARTRTRKAAIKLSLPKLTECPKCNGLKFSHRACSNCGYWSEKTSKPKKIEKETPLNNNSK